jgi:hypothetical protein
MRGCASWSLGKSVFATNSSSLIPANRCARDGQESGPFASASRARYASRQSTALMRHKVGVFDKLSANLWSDNQLYCVSSSANVVRSKVRYSTKNGRDRAEKRWRIGFRRPGMLRGRLSGPPAPSFLNSYARRVGTNENSGEKVIKSNSPFCTWFRYQTNSNQCVSMSTLPDFGLNNLLKGVRGGTVRDGRWFLE